MSDINTTTTYHMSLNPQIYEPSRSNAFEFILNTDLNNMLLAGTDKSVAATEEDYLRGVAETIRVAVVESSVPHFKIDPIEIRRGNAKVLFAGLPSFESGELKLNDFVGARTKDALMAWQALAYDVTRDVVHLASNYKYDCTLVEYSPDLARIVRSWRLIGCWVSDIREDNFNHEENTKRSLTATIQYDRAIPDWTNA